MQLNKQELAAVLVGLRLVANDIREYGPEEIEGLCKRLRQLRRLIT